MDKDNTCCQFGHFGEEHNCAKQPDRSVKSKVKFVQVAVTTLSNRKEVTTIPYAVDDKGRIWRSWENKWVLIDSPTEPAGEEGTAL